MIIISSIIVILYTVLILWLLLGISKTPIYRLSDESIHRVGFSLLIPFRNELENLPELLQSIQGIQYDTSLYEIIMIDDDSDDNSVEIIQTFITNNPDISIRVIPNKRYTESSKKDAITLGVKKSQFDWIYTVDADCILSEKCLQVYADFIQNNEVVFVAGPVAFIEEQSFVNHFQVLDWLSLTGVTIGSFGWHKPMLCSGANLVYSKEAFYQIQGFKGNDHIASGDDVFLLAKMQHKFPKQLAFLNHPQVLVQTKGEETWQDLWWQHIRWAGKTSKIPNRLLQFTGILVLSMNLLFLSLLISTIFIKEYLFSLVLFFVVKLFVDGVLLLRTSKILNQKIYFLPWFLGSICYPFFSVSIAFMSLFLGYTWKGRRFLK